MEKFFPISVNPNLCARCEKCLYSCHSKAIFFKDSLRYVNYDKCKGCLKCVNVCEHGAIEVISLKEGTLKGFQIDEIRCKLCKKCISENFCFQNLYEVKKDEIDSKEYISFNKKDISRCWKCLKCFKTCPENAIIPIIE
ncbi:MAG: 4Fe-4S binding protein [Candidatus Lokiarchaeota archaeon]